jgi:hypothetical protein
MSVYSSTGRGGVVVQLSVTSWWRASDLGRTCTVVTVGALTSYLNSQPTRKLIVFPEFGMAQTL